MHISYESGILENPNSEPPSDLFLMTRNPSDTPDKKYRIEIEFTRGFPVLLRLEDGSEFKDKLEIFTTLNKLAGDRGIGRIDIVENRFIGLKVNLLLIRIPRLLLFPHFSLEASTKLQRVISYI